MARRRLGRRIAATGAILIAVMIAGAGAWRYALGWHPSTATYQFQGVDASQDQGAIDWPSVAADGADFAYLRATMGADARDAQFAANWQSADDAGLRRGAMHDYSLCQLAVDQANNFNTTVPRSDDTLPAAIDFAFRPDCASRPGRAVLLDEVRRFITMVEAHTGKPVLLRIDPAFEAAYRISAAIPRTVWATRDFFPPDYTARGWRMWQASDLRRIDGIDGPVHWDVVAP